MIIYYLIVQIQGYFLCHIYLSCFKIDMYLLTNTNSCILHSKFLLTLLNLIIILCFNEMKNILGYEKKKILLVIYYLEQRKEEKNK
jgi:hypothetical protein